MNISSGEVGSVGQGGCFENGPDNFPVSVRLGDPFCWGSVRRLPARVCLGAARGLFAMHGSLSGWSVQGRPGSHRIVFFRMCGVLIRVFGFSLFSCFSLVGEPPGPTHFREAAHSRNQAAHQPSWILALRKDSSWNSQFRNSENFKYHLAYNDIFLKNLTIVPSIEWRNRPGLKGELAG